MIKKSNILFIFFFFLIISGTVFSKNGKTALLYSKYTERIMPDSFRVYNHITFWELFLTNNKINYNVIFDEDLESGISVKEYSSLIISSAKALSDEELISITDYLSEGGSILATWSMAYFNKDGSKRGWETIENIFGVEVVSEISETEINLLHTFYGDNQFSINIPSGFKFSIISQNSPVKTKISSSTSNALGLWYNYDSLEISGTNGKYTSMVYGNYGAGKFVWLGFDEFSVIMRKEYQANYYNFLTNSLNWLNDKPAVWINNWPNGEKSAVVLSCDVEFQSEKILNALDIINKENIKGQFFILTGVIKKEILNEILKAGDIGLHGDSHELFKYQEYETQLSRLNNAINFLESETGREIIAFRPPETMFDEQTIKALKETGIKILSSDLTGMMSVPYFYDEEKNIVVIPKTGIDDYDLFFNLKIKDYKKQAEKYLNDYYRVHNEGGLYTLYYHSHLQCLADYVEALRICIREFKKNRSWITTNSEVKNWWIFRNSLSLSVKQDNENQLILNLKNRNSTNGENIVVSLAKENFNSNLIVKDEEGRDINFTYNSSAKIIKIFIEKISSYEDKKIIISAGQI